MKNVRANVRFWVVGVSIALLGVVLSRVVASHCPGSMRLIVTLGGQLIALSGLFIICLGVRQRLRKTESATGTPRIESP